MNIHQKTEKYWPSEGFGKATTRPTFRRGYGVFRHEEGGVTLNLLSYLTISFLPCLSHHANANNKIFIPAKRTRDEYKVLTTEFKFKIAMIIELWLKLFEKKDVERSFIKIFYWSTIKITLIKQNILHSNVQRSRSVNNGRIGRVFAEIQVFENKQKLKAWTWLENTAIVI